MLKQNISCEGGSALLIWSVRAMAWGIVFESQWRSSLQGTYPSVRRRESRHLLERALSS
jgi:hypothetical protein